MARRSAQRRPDLQHRENVLRKVLKDGAAWETSTLDALMAWEEEQGRAVKVSAVKGKKGPARLGARQVKYFKKGPQ